MQILGVSVFNKTSLKELIKENQINQNIKDQYTLFIFNFYTHKHYPVVN